MPTYAYKCYDCGAEFEVSQKITADPITVCESCGGENVKRQLFASPFQLKGTGWYKTDYASSSSSNNPAHKPSVKKEDTANTPVVTSSEKKESTAAPSTPAATVSASS